MATYDNEKHDKIERYLAGDLDAGQRKSFEENLHKDKSLRRDLQLHKAVDATLADEKETALEKTLQGMRPAAKVRRISRLRSIAAALAFLIAGYFMYNLIFGGPAEADGPIAAWFEAGNMDVTELSAESDLLLSEGQDAYNAGKFSEALNKLEAYLQQEPTHESVRIFASRAAIADQQYEKALSLLTWFEGKSSLNIQEVTWLNALALSGLDRNEEARPLLDALKSTGDDEWKYKADGLYNAIY
ncbi:MAG: hypothetical protein GYB31_11185 [Bacteroidetes bacterium]|nr:hypothetical protein [Bacteroidota bacterium]